MIGMGRLRSGFLAFAALTALAVPASAVGDHGSGGGGGGGAPPPPAAAPSVTFTPTSLTFAAQAIGTTSAPQSITITNTGKASLFINSAAVPNTLDFTEVNDGCSGLTLAAGTSCRASGGTPPYRWSGQVPAGLTLRPSGLLLGAPSVKGTSTFMVTVTDAAGATATGTFSLTVTDPPPPTPPGCQTGGVLKEPLSGPAFNGRTPSGQATADETRFSGCGGFSLLSVQVKDVNLPDGTQLWVTLDFGPVGTIVLRAGSGTMPTYDMGRSGVSNDDVRVYSALPDITTSQQILIGGAFQ